MITMKISDVLILMDQVEKESYEIEYHGELDRAEWKERRLRERLTALMS